MFQFLKNKHLILAMFVAPLLAVIAYFAVDHVVSEVPHVAEEGNSYKLVASSNCRYQSGHCTLQNGDVEVSVTGIRAESGSLEMILVSALPVNNVLLALEQVDDLTSPVAMQRDESDPTLWYASFPIVDPQRTVLRLALSLNDTMYYAETTAIFIDYETAFSRDNFTQR